MAGERGVARVTMRDVAAASGVSNTTGSFVLNDRPDQTISPPTRERVLRVARELGNAPHGIARALREGRSRVVVVIIRRGLDTPYARSFVEGLDVELRIHDHVVLVRHGDPDHEAMQELLDTIMPRTVLDIGGNYVSGHDLEDPGGGWQDGLAAHTALQFRYLVEHGHARIAMAFGGPEESLGGPGLSEVRRRFAHEAARMLDLEPLHEVTLAAPRAAAAAALDALLCAHPEVTAVAGSDDHIALRALAALSDLGVAVPERIAVIGFDDVGYGALATPALTTVAIDAAAHGRRAARLALGLDFSDVEPAPGRVLVRDSA